MAAYNFERFSILVVEDNTYMRLLLVSVLSALGFGTVLAEPEGGKAIETLKLVATKPQRVGIMSLDMIVADWYMAPVDGAMLLNWVRRDKESPDRFIPFTMLTGLADLDKVAEARDAGATEFLAKPFSVDALCERLTSIIERPRQFVMSPDYFGPDRRRRVLELNRTDRRVAIDEEAEIMYESE